MVKLVLVLGDQLSPDIAALRAADRDTDVVVMAEVRAEATYTWHHKRKIALIFSAMRHFAEELRADGWTVAYTTYDDPENAGSIPGELLRRAEAQGASQVIATEPGEWRLIEALRNCPLDIEIRPDDRFIASHGDFAAWADGRKELRMEWFYREMRRKTGYLMEGDAPAGGKWNYDSQNRKPAARDLLRARPMQFEPDATTRAVLDLVDRAFPDNFGRLEGFACPVTREQARRALTHFVKRQLPEFGDYQDAMLTDEPWLNHAVLSAAMNIGLLDPREVCDAVQAAWEAGTVPINSAEGFIRQVIGWREYVRGIYFREGPDYPRRNALNHRRGLPDFYWTGDTRMNCMAQAIGQTRDLAYAHHIQRLMITGNFALIAGLDPAQVHEWYLSVYIDAFEWVEAPNTVGMSLFADGGIIASKPYAASANYVSKMSDYCRHCAYSARDRTGEKACPFNFLYWNFMDRHRDRFGTNPRMGNIFRTWDRLGADEQQAVRDRAAAFLSELSSGKTV